VCFGDFLVLLGYVGLKERVLGPLGMLVSGDVSSVPWRCGGFGGFSVPWGCGGFGRRVIVPLEAWWIRATCPGPLRHGRLGGVSSVPSKHGGFWGLGFIEAWGDQRACPRSAG